MTSEFWALDFEASGLDLNDSYPIEVGYTNGSIHKATLIKPHSTWTHWNKDSEAIHGIDRNSLLYGKDVFEVCEQLNIDLLGQNVIVDGGRYDQFWLDRLYQAANMIPTFTLSYVRTMFIEPVKHRALADAEQIWKAYKTYLNSLPK